ncbi:MAG: hypothetical protein JXQ73_08195 [Phycisphaerae bacterium]|nr:hypothetical protein [Phycisphaerae bacterium]
MGAKRGMLATSLTLLVLSGLLVGTIGCDDDLEDLLDELDIDDWFEDCWGDCGCSNRGCGSCGGWYYYEEDCYHGWWDWW